MPLKRRDALTGANLRARDSVVRIANQPNVSVRDGAGLVVEAARGSLEVGRLVALATMGGLARVSVGFEQWEKKAVPVITVETGTPLEACFGCQYAGWNVKWDGKSAMGSGPGRLKVGGEDLLLRYRLADSERGAVFFLETAHSVDALLCEKLAAAAHCQAADLAVVSAPTACLVGSVQVAARVVETTLHQWELRGGDVRAVRAAMGTSPIAPPAKDDLTAIGWTNDAILYGGQAWLWVDEDDRVLERLVPSAVSSASASWGTPFTELIRNGKGFYDLDPGLFAPAVVHAVSLRSGKTFQAGRLDRALLRGLWQWDTNTTSFC